MLLRPTNTTFSTGISLKDKSLPEFFFDIPEEAYKEQKQEGVKTLKDIKKQKQKTTGLF